MSIQIAKINDYCTEVTDVETGKKTRLNVMKNENPPKLQEYQIRKTKLSGSKISKEKITATTIDLTSKMPPIYDQGQLGSCVANATAGCLSYIYKKNKGSFFDGSRLFLYFNGRAVESVDDQDPTYVSADTGLYIHDGFRSVANYGLTLETNYTYNIANFAYLPSDAAYLDAGKHKTLTYQSIAQNLTTLKNSLQAGIPIAIGINVYNNFYNANTTGTVPMPLGTAIGGHAILLVGYNDTTQRFIFRNSWGISWGSRGYGTIPYAYIMSADAYDFIVATNFA